MPSRRPYKHRHPETAPSLLFANNKGQILEYDGMYAAASAAGSFFLPNLDNFIELPEGSELFTLPGRMPVGIEADTGEAALLDSNPYDATPIQAVAAFMAPAYTSTGTAAYVTRENESQMLPLFAYTAVGWEGGRFWVTAFRSDNDIRQDICQFKQKKLERLTRKKLKKAQHNRLIQHLGKCCLTYCCPAARNYFLNRWEAPLPCSPVCNAACAGCISLQPSGCCPSSQSRISFVPTPKELSEIAIEHLKTAPGSIVSFGQGCEGEPLMQADVMEQAIMLTRKHTGKGTINLNTNGSLPEAVERLAIAGLDSIRISLNSARKEIHSRYYRPKGFDLGDVRASGKIMKRYNRHVSLNYFIFPGVTDTEEEFAALLSLIESCRPDFIQLRNLNMDPEEYVRVIRHKPGSHSMGIRIWLQQLKKTYPHLKFGYFNPQVQKGSG
ncbi:MAG: radical SAM protein [Desulfobulbus propionicus]|nr:MAG: radical SAM protein [Desulfobulbus propionicus]